MILSDKARLGDVDKELTDLDKTEESEIALIIEEALKSSTTALIDRGRWYWMDDTWTLDEFGATWPRGNTHLEKQNNQRGEFELL